MFQTPTTKKLVRSDHVWTEHGTCYKCVICGGITDWPPSYPTEKDWLPDRFEALTDDERALTTNRGGKAW